MNVQTFSRLSAVRLMRLFMMMALSAVALSLSLPAHAQQVTALYGETTEACKTYNFQVGFQENLTDHYAYSVDYRNDGHCPYNHRDGMAFNGWYRTSFFTPKFHVQFGGGPYLFADTLEKTNQDHHGVAADLAVAATYELPRNFFVEARADQILTYNDINTRNYLLGVGYHLNETTPSTFFVGADADDATKSSISALAGRTVVNIRTNGRAIGEEIEFRRELKPWLDYTVAMINEGDSPAGHREGVAPELWLKKTFFTDHLELGFGGGAYVGGQNLKIPDERPLNGAFVSGIVSLTVAYKLTERFGIRADWHRPTTFNTNSDSDLWFFGLDWNL